MQVILISAFAGVPVDSVVLNNVSNLPPGISTPVMFLHVLGTETQLVVLILMVCLPPMVHFKLLLILRVG